MVLPMARAWWGSLFFAIFLACLKGRDFECQAIPRQELLELREEVRSMFNHAVNGYMEHAFPHDELLPLSCKGKDTLGGYSLTLVDSLDSIALMGNTSLFARSVEWLSQNLDFDRNVSVSVFETNIRVLGGLLSAHLLATDESSGVYMPSYDGGLLTLAHDLGLRLLPAFDTPTGIPYGTVNLKYGVPKGENTVTSTAGGGTLTLEFGLLSRLTGDCRFEAVAKNAALSLWSRRSSLHLMGGHIDVFSGEWTHKDAGIGTSIDSFFEYLLKAYLLLSDAEYFETFNAAYAAVMQHLHRAPWYVEVNMDTGVLVWPIFNSMQAFWPGLQVLAGNVADAERTHEAFASVWRLFGSIPEGFNLARMQVQNGQGNYPLRPELVESTYLLYQATRASKYLEFGRDVVTSLQRHARTACGFAHLRDVVTRQQDDAMESFFLAETLKYLFLLFDASLGGDNYVDRGNQPYIFSTEGHPFPINQLTATPAPGHGSCCARRLASCFDYSWRHQVWRHRRHGHSRSGRAKGFAAVANYPASKAHSQGGGQGVHQGAGEGSSSRSCAAGHDLGHQPDAAPVQHALQEGLAAHGLEAGVLRSAGPATLTHSHRSPSCAFTPIPWDKALLQELMGGPRVRPPAPLHAPLDVNVMTAGELATARALKSLFLGRKRQVVPNPNGFVVFNQDGTVTMASTVDQGASSAGGGDGGGGDEDAGADMAAGMFFLFQKVVEMQQGQVQVHVEVDAGIPTIAVGDVGMVRSVGTDAAQRGTLELGTWGQHVFLLQQAPEKGGRGSGGPANGPSSILGGASSPDKHSLDGEVSGEGIAGVVPWDSKKHEEACIRHHSCIGSRSRGPICGLDTRQGPPAATLCRWWSWGQGPRMTANRIAWSQKGHRSSGSRSSCWKGQREGWRQVAWRAHGSQLSWGGDGRVKLCWGHAMAGS